MLNQQVEGMCDSKFSWILLTSLESKVRWLLSESLFSTVWTQTRAENWRGASQISTTQHIFSISAPPSYIVLSFLLVLGHSHAPPLVSYSMWPNTASDSWPPLLPSYLCWTVLDFIFKALVILPGNQFYLGWQLQLLTELWDMYMCVYAHFCVCLCIHVCKRDKSGERRDKSSTSPPIHMYKTHLLPDTSQYWD